MTSDSWKSSAVDGAMKKVVDAGRTERRAWRLGKLDVAALETVRDQPVPC